MAFNVDSTEYNAGYPSNFMLNFNGLNKVNFWLQSVNIPSINADGMIVQRQFGPQQFPTAGNVIWTPLIITFIVDEDLSNWKEIYDWILKGWDPATSTGDDAESVMMDGSLHIFNNNKNLKHEIVFYDAFPTVLGDVQYQTTSDGLETLQCDITMAYKYYKFVK